MLESHASMCRGVNHPSAQRIRAVSTASQIACRCGPVVTFEDPFTVALTTREAILMACYSLLLQMFCLFVLIVNGLLCQA